MIEKGSTSVRDILKNSVKELMERCRLFVGEYKNTKLRVEGHFSILSLLSKTMLEKIKIQGTASSEKITKNELKLILEEMKNRLLSAIIKIPILYAEEDAVLNYLNMVIDATIRLFSLPATENGRFSNMFIAMSILEQATRCLFGNVRQTKNQLLNSRGFGFHSELLDSQLRVLPGYLVDISRLHEPLKILKKCAHGEILKIGYWFEFCSELIERGEEWDVTSATQPLVSVILLLGLVFDESENFSVEKDFQMVSFVEILNILMKRWCRSSLKVVILRSVIEFVERNSRFVNSLFEHVSELVIVTSFQSKLYLFDKRQYFDILHFVKSNWANWTIKQLKNDLQSENRDSLQNTRIIWILRSAEIVAEEWLSEKVAGFIDLDCFARILTGVVLTKKMCLAENVKLNDVIPIVEFFHDINELLKFIALFGVYVKYGGKLKNKSITRKKDNFSKTLPYKITVAQLLYCTGKIY